MKVLLFILTFFVLLIPSITVAHTDGIYNRSANSVGDTQGIDSNGGASAPIGCTQATAFLARKSGTTNNAALTTYICGLVTDGVWAKLDALYVFAQDTSANSLLNLVSATFNATNFGTTFTAGGSGVGGFAGDGATTFVSSNFIMNSGGTLYAQDSASLFVWSNSATTANVALAGCGGGCGGGHTFIYTDSSGTAFFDVQGNTGYTATASVSDALGFYAANRSSASNVQGFKNGSSIIAVTSDTSSALTVAQIIFGLGDNGGAFSNQQFMIGGFGSSLSSTDNTNLYVRTHTLLQTIAGIL